MVSVRMEGNNVAVLTRSIAFKVLLCILKNYWSDSSKLTLFLLKSQAWAVSRKDASLVHMVQ